MRQLLPFFLIVFCIPDVGFAQEPDATDPNLASLWTREGMDWPSFLGPQRNSQSSETGLRFNWTDNPPEIVWKQRVGDGYGSGSVARGRYFHFDRQKDLARLVTRHAETGELIWQFTYSTDYSDTYGFDGGPRSSPVIDDDRVYIFGAEGMLHCLNAVNGDVVWKVDTSEKFGVIQNFFGVGSTPLVHGDLLITMIGGSPSESRDVAFGRLDEVKPDESGVVAFDKLTGEVRYRSINDLASYASPVVAELNGKLTGLAFCRSGLFGFDPDTGAVGFEFPYRARKFESVNASTPVVVNSRILITESYGPGGALIQIANGKPERIWADDGRRDASLACHWNTPVVVDGFAYASSGSDRANARLQCVRLSDGKIMWQEPALTRSSLALADGHLVCLTETGRLFAFRPDPAKFEIVGECDVDLLKLVAPCWAAPFVSHGFLYIRGKSQVICIDIAGQR